MWFGDSLLLFVFYGDVFTLTQMGQRKENMKVCSYWRCKKSRNNLIVKFLQRHQIWFKNLYSFVASCKLFDVTDLWKFSPACVCFEHCSSSKPCFWRQQSLSWAQTSQIQQNPSPPVRVYVCSGMIFSSGFLENHTSLCLCWFVVVGFFFVFFC